MADLLRTLLVRLLGDKSALDKTLKEVEAQMPAAGLAAGATYGKGFAAGSASSISAAAAALKARLKAAEPVAGGAKAAEQEVTNLDTAFEKLTRLGGISNATFDKLAVSMESMARSSRDARNETDKLAASIHAADAAAETMAAKEPARAAKLRGAGGRFVSPPPVPPTTALDAAMRRPAEYGLLTTSSDVIRRRVDRLKAEQRAAERAALSGDLPFGPNERIGIPRLPQPSGGGRGLIPDLAGIRANMLGPLSQRGQVSGGIIDSVKRVIERDIVDQALRRPLALPQFAGGIPLPARFPDEPFARAAGPAPPRPRGFEEAMEMRRRQQAGFFLDRPADLAGETLPPTGATFRTQRANARVGPAPRGTGGMLEFMLRDYAARGVPLDEAIKSIRATSVAGGTPPETIRAAAAGIPEYANAVTQAGTAAKGAARGADDFDAALNRGARQMLLFRRAGIAFAGILYMMAAATKKAAEDQTLLNQAQRGFDPSKGAALVEKARTELETRANIESIREQAKRTTLTTLNPWTDFISRLQRGGATALQVWQYWSEKIGGGPTQEEQERLADRSARMRQAFEEQQINRPAIAAARAKLRAEAGGLEQQEASRLLDVEGFMAKARDIAGAIQDEFAARRQELVGKQAKELDALTKGDKRYEETERRQADDLARFDEEAAQASAAHWTTTFSQRRALLTQNATLVKEVAQAQIRAADETITAEQKVTEEIAKRRGVLTQGLEEYYTLRRAFAQAATAAEIKSVEDSGISPKEKAARLEEVRIEGAMTQRKLREEEREALVKRYDESLKLEEALFTHRKTLGQTSMQDERARLKAIAEDRSSQTIGGRDIPSRTLEERRKASEGLFQVANQEAEQRFAIMRAQEIATLRDELSFLQQRAAQYQEGSDQRLAIEREFYDKRRALRDAEENAGLKILTEVQASLAKRGITQTTLTQVMQEYQRLHMMDRPTLNAAGAGQGFDIGRLIEAARNKNFERELTQLGIGPGQAVGSAVTPVQPGKMRLAGLGLSEEQMAAIVSSEQQRGLPGRPNAIEGEPEAKAETEDAIRIVFPGAVKTFSDAVNTFKEVVTAGSRPLPQYEEGVLSVPQTGAAVVHKGEMILPAGNMDRLQKLFASSSAAPGTWSGGSPFSEAGPMASPLSPAAPSYLPGWEKAGAVFQSGKPRVTELGPATQAATSYSGVKSFGEIPGEAIRFAQRQREMDDARRLRPDDKVWGVPEPAGIRAPGDREEPRPRGTGAGGLRSSVPASDRVAFGPGADISRRTGSLGTTVEGPALKSMMGGLESSHLQAFDRVKAAARSLKTSLAEIFKDNPAAAGVQRQFDRAVIEAFRKAGFKDSQR